MWLPAAQAHTEARVLPASVLRPSDAATLPWDASPTGSLPVALLGFLAQQRGAVSVPSHLWLHQTHLFVCSVKPIF